MNDQDQEKLVANITWFNQFFGGIRQLYEIVVEMLSSTEFFPDDFALKNTNFYFPRQNWVPTIPSHYVLMVGGRRFALQLVAVFDIGLFGKPGLFDAEPSLVAVLHSQPSRYAYATDYALSVIGNRRIEIVDQTSGKFRGKITAKPPADFFSFQVPFDKFSPDKDPHDTVRQYLTDPIIEYLNDKH